MIPVFNARWGRGQFALLALDLLTAAPVRHAGAHDLYTVFIQHRIQADVGARYIDVTVDLTFFEEWSTRERHRMDGDLDGRITRAEIESYLRTNASMLAKKVRLVVADREIPLAELYEPEVDLLGNDRAGPGHHQLRLFLFAPTPASLRVNDSLVIEDRLWSDTKALVTLHAEGRDGCRLKPEKLTDPSLPPAQPGEARVFRVRCLQPPKAPPGNQESAQLAFTNEPPHSIPSHP